ncbi:energy transducer TonB [Candidatus Vallotia cooleyia]|uniref:energy transducer TonB n=1 Tax=Candidatus Vallotiella adelgis TaxID=1177211 RepID=UPI001D01A479|nr:energy transducer TonB [Candidatus Vallotia cooleyia]
MKSIAEYSIKPPRERGTLRALMLATLMHVLLAFFLCQRVKWQNIPPNIGAEAEIWTEITKTPLPPAPMQIKPMQIKSEEADIVLQQEKQHQKEAVKVKQPARQKLNQARRVRLVQLQGLVRNTRRANKKTRSGKSGRKSSSTIISSYADKVQRRVRPNIIWSGPTEKLDTLITVRCAPDGAVLATRIARSSGNSQWDNAARRAVERSDPMPLDTYGKALESFNIQIQPAAK